MKAKLYFIINTGVKEKNEFSLGTFNVISYSSMEFCKTMFASHVPHTSTVKIVFPVEFGLTNSKRKPIIEQEKRIDDLSGRGKKKKIYSSKIHGTFLHFILFIFFCFQKVASLAKEKYFVTHSLKPVDCEFIVISDALPHPTAAGQSRFATTLSYRR